MDNPVTIDVVLLDGGELPVYKTLGSSGMDLCAAHDVVLYSNTPTLVKTGIRMAIPEGYEGQIRPRSGLALGGVTIVNTPGTIDSDYRGEIGVILLYFGSTPYSFYTIKKGDRIAQLVICKVERAMLKICDDLNTTERGYGGFGHTGK